MFEPGLWGDPTHKSPSDLIILHYAQFHLQLPKQIVHPQVPDAERHKTKAWWQQESGGNKDAESPANFPHLYQVKSNTRARNGFQLEIIPWRYLSQLSWGICSSKPDIIKLTTSMWTRASGPRITQRPCKNSSVLAALLFLKFRDLAFSNSAGFYDTSIT